MLSRKNSMSLLVTKCANLEPTLPLAFWASSSCTPSLVLPYSQPTCSLPLHCWLTFLLSISTLLYYQPFLAVSTTWLSSHDTASPTGLQIIALFVPPCWSQEKKTRYKFLFCLLLLACLSSDLLCAWHQCLLTLAFHVAICWPPGLSYLLTMPAFQLLPNSWLLFLFFLVISTSKQIIQTVPKLSCLLSLVLSIITPDTCLCQLSDNLRYC